MELHPVSYSDLDQITRIEKETNPPDAAENFDVTSLFPDPAEFGPTSSPDFMFPPLPPTPPELDETEK